MISLFISFHSYPQNSHFYSTIGPVLDLKMIFNTKNTKLFIFFGGFKILADNLQINVSYKKQENQWLLGTA